MVHPHCVMLHLAYWWLVTLLYRPSYRQASSNSSSEANNHIMVCSSYVLFFCMTDHIVQLCDEAAKNIMALLGTWKSLFGMRYVPLTLVQVTFSAGTVFLISIEHAMTSRPTSFSLHDSRAQLDLCIEYLSEAGKSFSAAPQVREILKKLRQTQFNRLHGRSTAGGHTASSSSSSTLPLPFIWEPPSVPPPTQDASSLLIDDYSGYFPSLFKLQDQESAQSYDDPMSHGPSSF